MKFTEIKKCRKITKKVLTHRGKADIISFAAADAAVSKEESKGLYPRPKSRGKEKNKKDIKKVLTNKIRHDIIYELSLRRRRTKRTLIIK